MADAAPAPLAAAAMHLEEEQEKPEVQRRVNALVRFWKIVAEMGPPEGHQGSAVWTAAASPLMSAEAEDELETLAYLIALRAQVPGAAEWLEGNPARVAHLERLLSGQGGHR